MVAAYRAGLRTASIASHDPGEDREAARGAAHPCPARSGAGPSWTMMGLAGHKRHRAPDERGPTGEAGRWRYEMRRGSLPAIHFTVDLGSLCPRLSETCRDSPCPRVLGVGAQHDIEVLRSLSDLAPIDADIRKQQTRRHMS